MGVDASYRGFSGSVSLKTDSTLKTAIDNSMMSNTAVYTSTYRINIFELSLTDDVFDTMNPRFLADLNSLPDCNYSSCSEDENGVLEHYEAKWGWFIVTKIFMGGSIQSVATLSDSQRYMSSLTSAERELAIKGKMGGFKGGYSKDTSKTLNLEQTEMLKKMVLSIFLTGGQIEGSAGDAGGVYTNFEDWEGDDIANWIRSVKINPSETGKRVKPICVYLPLGSELQRKCTFHLNNKYTDAIEEARNMNTVLAQVDESIKASKKSINEEIGAVRGELENYVEKGKKFYITWDENTCEEVSGDGYSWTYDVCGSIGMTQVDSSPYHHEGHRYWWAKVKCCKPYVRLG